MCVSWAVRPLVTAITASLLLCVSGLALAEDDKFAAGEDDATGAFNLWRRAADGTRSRLTDFRDDGCFLRHCDTSSFIPPGREGGRSAARMPDPRPGQALKSKAGYCNLNGGIEEGSDSLER